MAGLFELWSALTMARHEGRWLHPRAGILTLMAVVYSDRALRRQTLHAWHLPQNTSVWVFNNPGHLRNLTGSNDRSAGPDYSISGVCDLRRKGLAKHMGERRCAIVEAYANQWEHDEQR